MNRNKSISFGDKIFTRVTFNGRTIYNFVSESVSNMADLLSQIRAAMRDVQGLVMLHIRNYHQGWGEQRPLMLYAKRIKNADLADVEQTHGREMFFPWETH